jgi:peroxiredoxin
MKTVMKSIFASLLSLTIILSFLGCAGLAPDRSSGEKGVYPDIQLPPPPTESARNYLGLADDKPFSVTKISTQVIIFEILSSDCVGCNDEAPSVNELYRNIQSRPDLRDRIKIIGIGAGDKPSDLEKFRKKYAVSFPLFPDKDLSISLKLGAKETPTFIVVKINEDGTLKRVYFKTEDLGTAAKFLEQVVQRSGLEPMR